MLAHPRVIEGIDAWRYCVLRPGDNKSGVFEALGTALFRSEALGEELSSFGSTAQEFADDLRHSSVAGLRQLRAALLKAATVNKDVENPTVWLAVIVDQFEELFTLEWITPEERADFVRALALMARSGFIWIVLTCRGDFFPRLGELPREFSQLREGAGQLELQPPTVAEIQQMIRTPADMAHLRFEHDPQSGRSLDEDLLEAATRDPAALPLLEFALDELFKRRAEDGLLTFQTYREMGGMEGALRERANSVWMSLTDQEKRAFPEVMSLLVGVQLEDKDVAVRKRVPLDAATRTPGRRSLIGKLIAQRLCTTDTAGGIAVVGLTHEAMLENWPRLREWVQANRAFLKTRAAFGVAASIWTDHHRAAGFLLIDRTALTEVRELLEIHRDVLAPHEVEFFEASLAQQKRIRSERRIGILLALVVLAQLAVVRLLDPVIIEDIRLRGFDLEQQLAPRLYQPSPVRIVAIDDPSLRRVGQWPWPRAKLAQLVNAIAAGHPAALGVEIIFAEPDRFSPAEIATLPGIPENLAHELALLPPSGTMLADAFRKIPTVLGMGFTDEAAPALRTPQRVALVRPSGADPRPFLQSYGGLLRSVLEFDRRRARRGHAGRSARQRRNLSPRAAVCDRRGQPAALPDAGNVKGRMGRFDRHRDRKPRRERGNR